MKEKNLSERLDTLRTLIQTDDFLDGKGLSNEVNIQIFCYDAKDEMAVQHFVAQLHDNEKLACRVVECNLYRTFIEICDDLDITDKIPKMEESYGAEFLLEQLMAIGANKIINKIEYSPHERGDILLLTGVGDAFPFLRVHTLLEALQLHFSDIPILVMYPGKFNGYDFRLFDCLKPNGYYRAFKIV